MPGKNRNGSWKRRKRIWERNNPGLTADRPRASSEGKGLKDLFIPKKILDEVEEFSKSALSILNKLCPENFDKLVAQFNGLVIDTDVKLKKVLDIIWNKAIDEEIYSNMYSKLCRIISGRNPNFRTLLLTRFGLVKKNCIFLDEYFGREGGLNTYHGLNPKKISVLFNFLGAKMS